jgi:hypothetical protein
VAVGAGASNVGAVVGAAGGGADGSGALGSGAGTVVGSGADVG